MPASSGSHTGTSWNTREACLPMTSPSIRGGLASGHYPPGDILSGGGLPPTNLRPIHTPSLFRAGSALRDMEPVDGITEFRPIHFQLRLESAPEVILHGARLGYAVGQRLAPPLQNGQFARVMDTLLSGLGRHATAQGI